MKNLGCQTKTSYVSPNNRLKDMEDRISDLEAKVEDNDISVKENAKYF